MTDRELLQQALDALNALTKELLACRDELAERGARPETPHKQKLWDSAFNAYIEMAIPTYESIRARLAQPDSATHSADSAESFCKPEPVAVVQQEAYGRGQVLWVRPASEFADGTLLYTAPPKKEWVGLTENDFAIWREPAIGILRWAEAVLKEKNA